MPIVFRWIFTACLQRGLVTMFVLLGIFVIIEAFDKARFLGHGLTGSMLVEYILLKMPFMISGFMPVIVLLATSIYLTELSHNHELAALRAAGLGVNKILAPLLAVAAVAAGTPRPASGAACTLSSPRRRSMYQAARCPEDSTKSPCTTALSLITRRSSSRSFTDCEPTQPP